jgi:hypothetical protein
MPKPKKESGALVGWQQIARFLGQPISGCRVLEIGEGSRVAIVLGYPKMGKIWHARYTRRSEGLCLSGGAERPGCNGRLCRYLCGETSHKKSYGQLSGTAP